MQLDKMMVWPDRERLMLMSVHEIGKLQVKVFDALTGCHLAIDTVRLEGPEGAITLTVNTAAKVKRDGPEEEPQ